MTQQTETKKTAEFLVNGQDTQTALGKELKELREAMVECGIKPCESFAQRLDDYFLLILYRGIAEDWLVKQPIYCCTDGDLSVPTYWFGSDTELSLPAALRHAHQLSREA